jgi:hypothetical protein
LEEAEELKQARLVPVQPPNPNAQQPAIVPVVPKIMPSSVPYQNNTFQTVPSITPAGSPMSSQIVPQKRPTSGATLIGAPQKAVNLISVPTFPKQMTPKESCVASQKNTQESQESAAEEAKPKAPRAKRKTDGQRKPKKKVKENKENDDNNEQSKVAAEKKKPRRPNKKKIVKATREGTNSDVGTNENQATIRPQRPQKETTMYDLTYAYSVKNGERSKSWHEKQKSKELESQKDKTEEEIEQMKKKDEETVVVAKKPISKEPQPPTNS